jgi:P27 family predicted phage terminase small subunit
MARPRKPTAVKVLQGTARKDRLKQHEPKPEGKTTPPRFLNRYARAEWKRIVPELDRLGLFTKVDRASLAAYCQAYGRWVETENKINALTLKAENTIDKEGNHGDASNAYLLKTQAGNVIISPLLSIANRAMDQMHEFANEFGLSPVSRSRIDATPKGKEKSDFEKLLEGVPPSEL